MGRICRISQWLLLLPSSKGESIPCEGEQSSVKVHVCREAPVKDPLCIYALQCNDQQDHFHNTVISMDNGRIRGIGDSELLPSFSHHKAPCRPPWLKLARTCTREPMSLLLFLPVK